MLKQVLFGFTKIIAKNDARKAVCTAEARNVFVVFVLQKLCYFL